MCQAQCVDVFVEGDALYLVEIVGHIMTFGKFLFGCLVSFRLVIW